MANQTFDGGNLLDSTAARAEAEARKRWIFQIVLGVLVLAAGVLLLLDIAFPSQVPGPMWTVLLGAGSGMFWYAFFVHSSWWWAAIPAGALLGAAASPVMQLDLAGVGRWSEAAFLVALSTGFWAVYLQNHRRWWAVIPGGTILTLAVGSGVTEAVGGPGTGATILFGLAVTFVLVAVLPAGGSRHWWAGIVAVALAVVALVVLLQSTELLVVLNYVWPLGVIGGGSYLLWGAWRRRHLEPGPDRAKEDLRP